LFGVLLAAACSPGAPALPPGLTLEEHALKTAPTLEPLTFAPVSGTMQSLLAAHAQERAKIIPVDVLLLDGKQGFRIMLGTDTLTATENYSSDGSQGWVTVTRNDEEIYRIDTGMGSPIPALRGLWAYDDHWALETAYVTQESFVGRLTVDGRLLNDPAGYDDVFDFQLLHGKPWFFFKKRGKIGFSYDDHAYLAGYDEVPHYGCCSASALNPLKAENMVAFLARRGAAWYYVEAGVFK
jgi:hypothetical protein